jgi:methionine aminotransferase
VDWQAFAALLSDKTRLVILNTPHNPSATVWRKEDFAALWQAIGEKEIYVLSDEVYEHICFAEAGMPACWRTRNCVSGRLPFLRLVKPSI